MRGRVIAKPFAFLSKTIGKVLLRLRRVKASSLIVDTHVWSKFRCSFEFRAITLTNATN